MASNASDYNLQKISMKDLGDNLRTTIDYGGNIIVIGRRGSSKTMQGKQAIKASGCKELYLNLSTMERPDLGGYPNFFAAKQDKHFVDFLLPYWYEDLIEGDTPCVALLDEVDKAEAALWAPLLEFTQFHTINGRPLKNLQAIIMTGNLQSEGGQRPILPLLDRAEKYLLEVSHQHWLDWAAKEGRIHPSITAFISDNPDNLFGDTDPGDVYADESPRGWENSSKLITYGEEKHWPHKIMTNKVSGCIGKKTGIKYSAYFEHYQVLLPVVERIMKGEKIDGFGKLEPSKQIITAMIVCSRLARIVDDMKEKDKKDKGFPTAVEHVGSFLRGIDPEMTLISVRSQIGLKRVIDSGLDQHTVFDQILRELAKRING
jgi:hypothetical protein